MLSIRDITVRLGGRTIIDGASATLPQNGKIGLIGRNGAGKSTLVKTIIGELDPDGGSVEMPRRARLGYIAQEAPNGTRTPFEAVVEADTERTALLAEAETCTDPNRLGDVHERLIAIDAYTAPARAARILVGLGFDEEMQARPLDSFSGGWKMRVALASLLFSEPDVMLLDEPSNHLDLEATLWLENFLKSYPKTLLVISHERDLLNTVVDHILHLQQGKLTLYPGDYDSFERIRAERAAQAAAARANQEAQKKKLADYVARNSARASTAKQAQSRAKMLAKMQPIAAMAEDASLSFDFPSPDELRPPLITLDLAAVGYVEDKPILRRLNLRIDPEDRIALLGRNGNGKTTLARLLARQLEPMEGGITFSPKIRIGYFTQYQVEELPGDSTPLELMTRAMEGKPPLAVRGQLGRFGFSGNRATAVTGTLSGGERARLALALVTRDAPHMLILDEPTNHLDVDAREALVQALNSFEGAVILVSHDRHMVELAADRLVLVEGGTAENYDGSMEDYIDFVLGRNQPKVEAVSAKGGDAPVKKSGAIAREELKALRKKVTAAETRMKRAQAHVDSLLDALADPASAKGDLKGLAVGALGKLHGTAAEALELAETEWLEVHEELETLMGRGK
ncbi:MULTISPECIES: ABC-F family ATP-binding cassette domain-containing protein [Novosphingobium]|jgi:ATP-binding cassette subfamily F protein 3|uniref:ABC-F family ATP-binding cassette domain-containing protein n=1 Tax=Novosphingobium TaxID=165696 RepID=UPI0022F2954F|nr:ABC-F family ATP-binding cassette domain-containing protein [Novosphingobium resinovorum]GLK45254.1 glycosyl transferase family 1 [Novosphingobium resinovorum]